MNNEVWQTLTSGNSENDLSLMIRLMTLLAGSRASLTAPPSFIQATPRSRNPTLFCLRLLVTQDSAAIGLFLSCLIEANFTYYKHLKVNNSMAFSAFSVVSPPLSPFTFLLLVFPTPSKTKPAPAGQLLPMPLSLATIHPLFVWICLLRRSHTL